MCGIAGLLLHDPRRQVDRELLARMTGVLAHRGPDGQGFHIDGPVGLGHRRLSIIDLAGGTQPMSNEDGSIWIVFNGEIFNFPELRRELEQAGHVFRTRSDTECIVHLYEQHGAEGCASRLVGQFAFAIWDGKLKRLLLARDHVGVKPLYYHDGGDRLLFASEIKAILEDGAVRREVDPEALVDYLTYLYVPAPRSIFRGIRKLPAGHWLSWQDGKMRIQRYWKPALPGSVSGASEEDLAEKLRGLLLESVRGQLMSDVPLGAFLSGGIDSSIVVGMMAGLMDRPVKTFTIGFREETYSEVAYARQVAEMHGTEHRELTVDPESVDLLPRILRQFDEPFADPSAIPTYYVCRMAREHVTVCLSGDGGDEGFAGYKRYLWALKYVGLDWLPEGLRRGAFGCLERCLPGRRLRLAARRYGMDPLSRYAELFGYLGRDKRDALLAPGLRSVSASRPDLAVLREPYEEASSADYLYRLQHVDILTYLPDDILVKTDRMSMMHSLEVRVPLLDHRILEFAATVPPDLRRGKRILKLAAKSLLPPAILDRGKMGFAVPLKHWLRGDWRTYARDLLFSRRAVERGLLDPGAVRAVVDGQLDERSKATGLVYALVALEEWCCHHLDGSRRTP